MPAGFVITPNESNEMYLASWKGDKWEPIICETHERLLAVDPQYRIVQIKEKFWSLRYYFEASDGVAAEERVQMRNIVAEAETAIEVLEGRADFKD